ncbi:hypothetical protein [Demequina sp. NBRC 110056]|uniref:hypothetical protein n=1 Tax=Demequina sp. NBRC 110056 TaxID=1570345 RepID=UPI000A03287B|nr:hypothetical protein [Demequina sp. NBRC 110056]
MTEDLHSRLGGLIEVEGRASAPVADEVDLYAGQIRSRRRARTMRGSAVAAAVVGVVAVGGVALLGGWPDRAAEPASTIESIIEFAPSVDGLGFEADGAVLPAAAAYRDAAPAAQPVGCAALDEYARLVRPADLWASSTDVTVRTGIVTDPDGIALARVTSRWFVDGGAEAFVDDFATLAAQCAPGYAGLGGEETAGATTGDGSAPSGADEGDAQEPGGGEAPAVAGETRSAAILSVETGAVRIADAEEDAVRARLTFANGAIVDLYLLGEREAAIAVLTQQLEPHDTDAAAVEVLEQFAAQVLARTGG